MGDAQSTFEIKIQTDADLKALQAARTEFGEQAKVIRGAGGASKELEGKLEALDEQIGKRKLALYIADLQEAIAVMKAAGQECGTLETQLAAVQKATGGEDKWEQAGEIIGGGIKAAAAAAVTLAVSTSKAGEELRKAARDSAEDMRQLGATIESSPTAALEHATSKARALKTQLADLADKGWVSQFQDLIAEGFGKESIDEKSGKLVALLVQLQDLAHQGAVAAHIEALQTADAQKLRLEGLEAEAAAKEREIARDREIAKERQKFAPDDRDKPAEASRKKSDLAAAEADIRERYSLKEQEITKNREKAAAKQTGEMREQAEEAKLRDQNLDAAAEKKKRDYELEEKLQQIEKQRQAGKLTLGESVDQSDAARAKATAEQQKSDSDRAATVAKRLEMAREERESAEALLAGETAASQIAKINKQLEREKADIIKSNTPEIAAQLVAEKERTAEAKRQYATKKEKEKKDDDAAKAAEKEQKQQELFEKQKGDAEYGVKISKARAAGEADVVANLEIEKALFDKIAGIYKADLTPAQQAVLAGLAQEEASLQRVAIARGKFNKDFDKQIGEDNKTPQQKQQERDAKLKGESQERKRIGDILTKEDTDAAQKGERQRTAQEKEDRRHELEKERGRKTAKQRQEEKHGADKLEEDQQKIDEAKGKKQEPADSNHMKKPGHMAPLGHMKPNTDLPASDPEGDVTQKKGPADSGKTDGGKADADLKPVGEAAGKMQASVEAAASQLSAAGPAMQAKIEEAAAAIAALDISSLTSAIADLQSQIKNVRSSS